VPERSLMLHTTNKGSPLVSWDMESPCDIWGASWVWKGPRTVPSVELGGLGWSIESTSNERPRTSERRMNS
jgi:hypothetical protein